MPKIIILTLLIFFVFSKSKALQSQKNSDIENLFSISLEELLNIEITTAGKIPQKIQDVPASVVIISREDIETYGYQTFNDILQNIPGFYLINDYYFSGSYNLGVRGFFAPGELNEFVILINGVNQISDAGSDYPDEVINIPVEAIERIEIIKGPMSVIYGSGAFFGAINIITRLENIRTDNLVSGAYGNLNNYSLFSRLSHVSDDFAFDLNISVRGTDGINEKFSALTANTDYLTETNVSPDNTTEGLLPDKRISFIYSSRFKNFKLDLSHKQTKIGVFDAQPSVGNASIATYTKSYASLGYTKKLTDHVELTATAAYFYHQYYLDYEIYSAGSYGCDWMNSNAYELEMNADISIKNNLQATFGLFRRTMYYLQENVDYPFWGEEWTNGEFLLENPKSQNAFFSQWHYNPSDMFHFYAGFRLEYFDKYKILYTNANETPFYNRMQGSFDGKGLDFIPRFSTIININEQNIIKFMYGHAKKHSSFYENLNLLLYPDKPNLESEAIDTYEINLISVLSSDLSIGVNLFYNQLNKLQIRRNEVDPVTGEILFLSENAGKMNTKGLETNLKFNPNSRLIFDLILTYQDTKHETPGFKRIEPGYAPKLLGYANLAYSFNNGMIFGANARYVDAMQTFWDISIENADGSFGNRIGDKIDPYFVMDCNLRIEDILDAGIFASIKVSNILDQEIRYPTTLSNSWIEKGTLGFGRAIMLGVGTRF